MSGNFTSGIKLFAARRRRPGWMCINVYPKRVDVSHLLARGRARPEVLLCDEPTGALDCATGITVLESIARINVELGTTAAVITHNAAIKDMAHRVLMFGDGRITGTHVNASRKPPSAISW